LDRVWPGEFARNLTSVIPPGDMDIIHVMGAGVRDEEIGAGAERPHQHREVDLLIAPSSSSSRAHASNQLSRRLYGDSDDEHVLSNVLIWSFVLVVLSLVVLLLILQQVYNW